MVSFLASIFELFKEILSFFNIRSRRSVGYQIKKVVEIYDNMHKIINETDFHRVLVFKAHNGGGLIKPGSELYASCIYEDFSAPFYSVKNDYQKVAVDSEYVKLLMEIYTAGSVIVKVEDLREGSLLKTIYEGEGVKYAILHYLTQDSKNFYYCSVASHLPLGQQTNHAVDQLSIKVAINNIVNLMKHK